MVKEDDKVENIQIDKPLLKRKLEQKKYKEKEIKKKGKKKIRKKHDDDVRINKSPALTPERLPKKRNNQETKKRK